MRIAGVDEAGKGPCIGSLFMCGVAIEEKDIPKLAELGVKDSKFLNATKREAIYKELIKWVDYEVVVLSAEVIDKAVLHPDDNLNKLEARNTALILDVLKPKKAIIDCPDPTPSKYALVIGKHLKEKMELICEHKAERHLPVAAASIIAKVLRDRSIETLKETHKVDFGSGYASDEKAQVFLREHWQNDHYGHFIRKSWASFQNIKVKHEQQSLFSFK